MSLYIEHKQPKHLKAFQSMAAHWSSIKWVQRNNPDYLCIGYKDGVHLRNFHKDVSRETARIESLKLADLLQASPTPMPANVILLGQTPPPHIPSSSSVLPSAVAPANQVSATEHVLDSSMPSSSNADVIHQSLLFGLVAQVQISEPFSAVYDASERTAFGAGCSTSAAALMPTTAQGANAQASTSRQTALQFPMPLARTSPRQPDRKSPVGSKSSRRQQAVLKLLCL